MVDLYVLSTEFLKRNPTKILDIWDNYNQHPAGILFRYTTPSGDSQKCAYSADLCGDICEVASNEKPAYSKDITNFIRDDCRIPTLINNGKPRINMNNLYVFSEWQRIMDFTWDRLPENWIRHNKLNIGLLYS